MLLASGAAAPALVANGGYPVYARVCAAGKPQRGFLYVCPDGQWGARSHYSPGKLARACTLPPPMAGAKGGPLPREVRRERRASAAAWTDACPRPAGRWSGSAG